MTARAPARPIDVVVVGASLGGLDALEALLAAWPPGPPVAIAQHRRGDDHASRLVDLLRAHSRMAVIEVDHPTPLADARAHLAPPDYHLLIERGRCTLSVDPPVRHARPSIDVLFESAAAAYGAGVVAVVLTGSSDDGADGAAAVRARGGRVIVQDPATAHSPVAPAAALRKAGADRVLPLAEIAPYLTGLPRQAAATR